jgi:lipid A disaccharide synthetase
MVNLVAGRKIAQELIQSEMTAGSLAASAAVLLDDAAAREKMRADLREVAEKLSSEADPMEIAAGLIEKVWNEAQNR